MEYRRLGSSGLQVSALSFGAWVTFGDQNAEQLAEACMHAAYEAGVNFFDNAEGYAGGQAETMMGNIFKRSGWRRSDLIVSTKIFFGAGRSGPNDKGLSHKHVVEGTEEALARLQLDYVDLVFCHRPDVRTPIEETVRAMSYLINQGKAFYWGTSEWSAEQIMEAYHIARREHLVPPTMEQPQYNMFHRERVEKEYVRAYETFGLGTTIWSPLASGLLTGKYNDGVPDDSRLALPGYEWLREMIESAEGQERLAKVKKLVPVAEALDTTMAKLALAWCLKNPRVSTVITGASKPEQVVENMQALAVAERLTPEVMAQIEAILENKPAPEEDFRAE
jgi:voltage-dependent potassium channel beta subunit